jgi:hypothetical protein
MTEPDDRETRQALRAMLSDRIGALTSPAGVYETVRRRHRRRQRAIVGGALVLAVAAVAVPSIALADRSAAPPAADRRCVFPGNEPATVPEGVQLPAQRNVPGSLGGDAELVTAVLRAGWSAMRAEAGGSLLDPGTAHVQLVQRVEGQVIALVSATGLDRRLLGDTWVWGPDADHLVGMSAGGARSPRPMRTAYGIGDVLLQAIEVCGLRYVVVAAAPGTTGRASWISAITPQLRAERSSMTVPMRADGIAVFRSDAPDLRIRLERAGRSVWDGPLQSGIEGSPWQRPTEKDLDRVAAEAPGNGDPDILRSMVNMGLDGSNLPVQQSDQRVLWSGRAGSGTVAVSTCTLPGGVRYVTGGASRGVGSLNGPYYFGLLAPGALERTVLAWRPNLPGKPLVAFAVGGLRAEAVLADGDVARFALSGGGGVLESGATVRRVRVYGAGDRLIGEQVPGQGLADVPRETPL